MHGGHPPVRRSPHSGARGGSALRLQHLWRPAPCPADSSPQPALRSGCVTPTARSGTACTNVDEERGTNNMGSEIGRERGCRRACRERGFKHSVQAQTRNVQSAVSTPGPVWCWRRRRAYRSASPAERRRCLVRARRAPGTGRAPCAGSHDVVTIAAL